MSVISQINVDLTPVIETHFIRFTTGQAQIYAEDYDIIVACGKKRKNTTIVMSFPFWTMFRGNRPETLKNSGITAEKLCCRQTTADEVMSRYPETKRP